MLTQTKQEDKIDIAVLTGLAVILGSLWVGAYLLGVITIVVFAVGMEQ